MRVHRSEKEFRSARLRKPAKVMNKSVISVLDLKLNISKKISFESQIHSRKGRLEDGAGKAKNTEGREGGRSKLENSVDVEESCR